MVRIEKEICGAPPSLQTHIRYFCDQCGTECWPGGTRDQKLYEFDGTQLCFDCLFDVLTLGTIAEIE